MNLIVRWGPAFFIMFSIFYLSAQTGERLNAVLPWFQRWMPGIQGFDWAHFVAYFFLAIAFAWATARPTFPFPDKTLAVALSVLYGVTDEFHQRFIPGRTCDPSDLLHDGIGAVLAMAFLSVPPFSRWFSAALSSRFRSAP